MTTTTLDRPLPRSYMDEGKKAGWPQDVIFACESSAAMHGTQQVKKLPL
jgi:hypothetical protein